MLPMALEVLHNTTVKVEWQVFYRFVVWVNPESYKEIKQMGGGGSMVAFCCLVN